MISKTSNTWMISDNLSLEAQKHPFIFKLYDILMDDSNSEYVCWDSEGVTVLLKDPIQILEKVLPRYFNLTNYNSFLRQLCFYGFKRISRYETLGRKIRYFHPQFCKGNLNLLGTIKRRKAKPAGKKKQVKEVCEAHTLIAQRGNLTEESRLIEKLEAAGRLIWRLRYENKYLKREMELLRSEIESAQISPYHDSERQIEEMRLRSIQQNNQDIQYGEREGEAFQQAIYQQHSRPALNNFDLPHITDQSQEHSFRSQEKGFEPAFNSQIFEYGMLKNTIQSNENHSAQSSLSRKWETNQNILS